MWRPKNQQSDDLSDFRPYNASPLSNDRDSNNQGGNARFPRNARNSVRTNGSSHRRRNDQNEPKARGEVTRPPRKGRHRGKGQSRGNGRRRLRSRGNAKQSGRNTQLFENGEYVQIGRNPDSVAQVLTFKRGAYWVAFKSGPKAWFRKNKMSRLAKSINEEQFEAAPDDFEVPLTFATPRPSPAPPTSINAPSPDPMDAEEREAKEIELITEPGAAAPDEVDYSDDALPDMGQSSNNQEEPPMIATHDIALDVFEEDDAAQGMTLEVPDMTDIVPTPHPSPAPPASIRDPSPDPTEAKETELITEPGAAAPDEVGDVTEDEQFAGSQSSNNQQEPPAMTTSDTAVQARSRNQAKKSSNNQEAKEDDAHSMPFKIHKRPKDSAEKAKKSEMQRNWHKLRHKVKDKRERAFVAMCGRHDQLQLKQLNDFIVEIGGVTASRAQRLKVKRFFTSMNPNGNNRVSFSNFVKAIGEDGDVIKAYRRFKKK